MSTELLLEDLEATWRGLQASGECPFGCGTRSAFGVRLDGSEQDSGVYNCLKCGESGFIFGGRLYRKGEKLHRAQPPGGRSVPRLAPPPKAARVEAGPPVPGVAELLDRVLATYREQFAGSVGERYLKRRGFDTGRIGAGYAPGGRFLLERGFSSELLWNFGLIRADGTDFLERRVVLPYGWHGRTTCLFGRAVETGARVFRPLRHLYTRTSGRPVTDKDELDSADVERHPWLRSTGRFEHWRWNRGVYAEAALSTDGVMLVEGALDAEAANQLGAGPAVAIGGAGARRLLQVIRPDQRVRIGTDNDLAGENSFQAIQAELVWNRLSDPERQALRSIAFAPTERVDEVYARYWTLDPNARDALERLVGEGNLVRPDAGGRLAIPNASFRYHVQCVAGQQPLGVVRMGPPQQPPAEDVAVLGPVVIRTRPPAAHKDWAAALELGVRLTVS